MNAAQLDRILQTQKAVSEGRDPNRLCLRTDGASSPLPCGKVKGHDGPCYFQT